MYLNTFRPFCSGLDVLINEGPSGVQLDGRSQLWVDAQEMRRDPGDQGEFSK